MLVLAFLGLAVALMIPMSGWATASLTGGSPEPVRVVEVAPGDTLYGIAAELAEPGEIRAMVHRIQELNSLPGGQIERGPEARRPPRLNTRPASRWADHDVLAFASTRSSVRGKRWGGTDTLGPTPLVCLKVTRPQARAAPSLSRNCAVVYVAITADSRAGGGSATMNLPMPSRVSESMNIPAPAAVSRREAGDSVGSR